MKTHTYIHNYQNGHITFLTLCDVCVCARARYFMKIKVYEPQQKNRTTKKTQQRRTTKSNSEKYFLFVCFSFTRFHIILFCFGFRYIPLDIFFSYSFIFYFHDLLLGRSSSVSLRLLSFQSFQYTQKYVTPANTTSLAVCTHHDRCFSPSLSLCLFHFGRMNFSNYGETRFISFLIYSSLRICYCILFSPFISSFHSVFFSASIEF